MDRFESAALDRHITGNYGEDQFMRHESDGQCERLADDTGRRCPETEGLEFVEEDGWYCKPHGSEARAEWAEEENGLGEDGII